MINFTFRSKLSLLILFSLFPFFCFSQNLSLYSLTSDYANNPLGIANKRPKLGWKITSSGRNVLQTHYQIRVASSRQLLKSGRHLLWDTGKIKSEQSQQVVYSGTPLESEQQCFWQVRVWDNYGRASSWSDVQFWKIGLDSADWTAKWICASRQEDPRNSPTLRKELVLKKENILSATAYITALGLYEAYINGQKIGNAFFTPGWTSYDNRLQYQTYDVTSLVKKGKNIIGAMLGDGWYNGELSGKKDAYKKEVGLLFQMEICYKDGSKETVISDESWKSSVGGIRFSSIYHGEKYDSRLEKKKWNTADYQEDKTWTNVKILNAPQTKLVATISPPVREKEIFKAVKLIFTPKGDTVVDFGQNLVGWVKIKAKGPSGTVIKITHAEVLDKQGEFYIANLRRAKQELTLILDGSEIQEYRPTFSFQGFRYVKLQGYPGNFDIQNIEAVALYSDMLETGKFTTSNSLINQLQSNILWGQKGNFLDVPTDCPQRDERLGWTGDAQAFFYTAAYNMDVRGFFEKWLADLASDQRPDGNVPVVIPNFRRPGKAGSAGWADAATIIPWQFYVAYGDTAILEKQYKSMKAWVDFIATESEGYLWNKGKQHYGDWLFFSIKDDLFGRSAVTDQHLIAQNFYAHSVQNLINAARVLGNVDDVKHYTSLLSNIKKAFFKAYVTGSGRLVSNTQTAYILALKFDLLPENLRDQAAQRLVENIKSYKMHITTGFLGTPYICEVLSKFGYTDVAYELLMREKYPSWLYPVKMGATTIWERWDGIKPDGSFQKASMNSFNHYAYGAVGNWMYMHIAGIRPDETNPGYKHVIIAPEIGGKLTSASGELETVYGKVKSAWSLKGKQVLLTVEIPVNATASVYIPVSSNEEITESGLKIQNLKGITINRQSGKTVLKIGSGKYSFRYTL